MSLLRPSAPAFGHTSRLAKSLLFLEGDQWVDCENTEIDHERGEVCQLGASEGVREVRQMRERSDKHTITRLKEEARRRAAERVVWMLLCCGQITLALLCAV